MKRPPTRYVAAASPVNRRTSKATSPAMAAGVAGQRRALKVRNRLNLGAPLSARLRVSAQHAWPLALTMAASVLAACLVLLLVVSGLIGSAWTLASAAVLIGPWIAFRRRRPAAAPAAWLDHQSLAAFDRLLASAPAQLDRVHGERLREIKRELLEIARLDSDFPIESPPGSASRLAVEDRHFVLESLRRYLPDAMATYLALPDDARHRPLSGRPESPADLLTDQLQQVRDRLRLCAASALHELQQAVVRQQRFIQTKQRRR